MAGSTPATRACSTTMAICASPAGSRRSSIAAARRSRRCEVDDVLMDHPAVAQVVTFAMPHDKLGEEVAAAIVLREGIDGERERHPRVSAATRLADFKVPRMDPDPRRDPEGRDRQAAAHRPRGEARSGMMRITVFGAGAIGGYLAAKLAMAGRVDLSIVARGAHLDADQGGRASPDRGRSMNPSCRSGPPRGRRNSASRIMSCWR